ncbi:helix-turn-helix domain-containing protein [Actinomadura sp. 6N118]|uniref:nSTAND1 domain-containing NTPase n=1 Tax=Actinomadura sp. 6N118 TaxID=3375151 RepID=UPI0037B7DECB
MRRGAGRPERAVDPDAGPVERLAWELRQLREQAGAPSYRLLAKKAHYSASTLAEAARGRRLPTLEVTLAYVEACGGDKDEWTARWRAAAGPTVSAAGPTASDAEPESGLECPYPGLAAFQEQDARWFFGRDDLVARLADRLRREGGDGLTAVFGASGSGKSSLVRAGLIPALSAPWRPVVLTPGAHPLAELAAAIATVTGDDAEALRKRLIEDTGALDAPVGDWLARQPDEVRLLVVVDQFEEVFTLCADDAERSAFIRAIIDLGAVGHHPGHRRVRMLLAVRADFYAHCSRDPNLVVALREGTQLPIGPPGTAELHDIISGPAANAGLTVDPDLVATLISDAADQPGALPLLSHALRQTWQRRQGPALRLADYQASGGMRGGIAQTAEGIYLNSDTARRQAMRTIFVRLTALGEGTDDTRRRIDRAELTGIAPRVDVGDLLEELARARLIVLGEGTVEVAHEAVISAWPRLRNWLIDDRSGLRTHRRLTQAAVTWNELGSDRGALLRGGQLTAAQSWAQAHPWDLNDLEAGFLAASAAAARRRGRRSRQLIATMAVLLALALTAAVAAVRAERTADGQRRVALSEKVAADAAELREVNPVLAAHLSLAAYRLSPTVAARGSLMSGFAAPFGTRLNHEINTTAFTPDGRVLAAGGDDRTIRLWDVTTPHRPALLAALPSQPEDVESLVVTPNGKTLISANYDGSVRRWDISDPRHPALRDSLAAHKEAVFRAVLSPDGTTLATASADGTARLWELPPQGSPTMLAELTGHTDIVWEAAFSADGKTLATGSEDGTARLWNIADRRAPELLARLPDRKDAVTSVAFAPDGRTLAVAGYDHETKLWDVTRPGKPVALGALTGHSGPLRAVRFSPDGQTVASAGWDYTTRVWNVSDRRRPRPLMTLTGHTNTIWSLAFSPDGRFIVSASSDHTAMLTDVPGPLLSGHGGALPSVTTSPDGRIAAVGGDDFTTRLWNVHTGRPETLAELSGHTGQVEAVAFAGARILATGSIDTTVALWDLADPRRPVRLRSLRTHGDVRTIAIAPRGDILASAGGSTPGVQLWDISDPRHAKPAGEIKQNMGAISVAFSPRGRLLAVGQESEVHLWDVTDTRRPQRLAAFTAHPDTVQKVAFSPDGRRLATASLDGTARLWAMDDPRRPLATMTGHVGGVRAVAFSPDGRALATAGVDGTAHLWNLHIRPTLRAIFTGHTDRVNAVAFTPDGRTLLSSSEDRTARLWPTDPERMAAQVCAMAYPRITRAEWGRYFPGIDYRPPCR